MDELIGRNPHVALNWFATLGYGDCSASVRPQRYGHYYLKNGSGGKVIFECKWIARRLVIHTISDFTTKQQAQIQIWPNGIGDTDNEVLPGRV